MNAPEERAALSDPLVIAGRAYRSRLLVGTGKYRDFAQTREADRGVGCARSSPSPFAAPTSARTPNAPSLLDALPPTEFTYLPNSAGCYTADDAVRTLKPGARVARRPRTRPSSRCWAIQDTLYPGCPRRR